mmetsp:Transcript_43822/g.139664  ORF Transcript_43822/g.139664 Transcript_43822/m.139664 type:complete len:279 (+) Transcript_43822:176-1012(+)
MMTSSESDVTGERVTLPVVSHRMIVLPQSRPDLFQGLRAPARGLLLYGPPGNGKTMLARAAAAEAGCTFFSISASTLTSKWVGEGEKLVRALFAVARERQPALIFIDEIDSVLSARSGGEHEASRRLKTEFLVQFDGVTSGAGDERVMVLGATNRPQDLDDAVLRRLVKRIYIGLPGAAERCALLEKLFAGQRLNLSRNGWQHVAMLTEGYSASDLRAVAREAAMAPLRELGPKIQSVHPEQVRGVEARDFSAALAAIRPSVSPEHHAELAKWAAGKP